MPLRAHAMAGSCWVCHVAPPFVVPRTAPPPPTSYPTTSQVVTDGQATPSRPPIPLGRFPDVHDPAPSRVDMITGTPPSLSPIATQVEGRGHATPSNSAAA